MASVAAKIFMDYLVADDVNAEFVDEGNVIRVGWKVDNTTLTDYIIFDDDNKYVQIQGHEFATVSENKFDVVLREINKCNKEFRWAKFYLDEQEHEIVVMSDAIIELGTCAEEVDEIMHRLNQIVDEAYPRFMRAMWS